MFRDGPDGTTEYAYDADGIRVRSVTDGVVTNYLVDKNRPYAQVLEERDDAGSLTVSYVYGDDLISQRRGGSVSYYHYDGLGSTRVLTDDAGGVTDTYTYEAFGDLIDHIGETENNYLFTGEQYDPNAGFYYLRARCYNAGNGRFISQDSWQGSISNPDTLHKYVYGKNNPVLFIDPSGHFFSLGELGVASSLRNILSNLQINTAMNIVESRDMAGSGTEDEYLDDKMNEFIFAAVTGIAPRIFKFIGGPNKRRLLKAAGIWKGSGPAPGVLGVNAFSKSTKALQNYNPKEGIEFVFDYKTDTFAVGKPKGVMIGSPHENLAHTIGGDKTSVVGGVFRRADGKMLTDESSGHFGEYWTPEIRERFRDTMKRYGLDVEHSAVY